MSTKLYRTRTGAHPSIQINVLDYLPRERYLLALERIKSRVERGEAIQAYPDEPDCSWGLCHDHADTWPDAQDHVFPKDFEQRGRITPLDPARGDRCPMDDRPKSNKSGCFYRCAVFNPGPGTPEVTKQEALRRLEMVIFRARQRLGE